MSLTNDNLQQMLNNLDPNSDEYEDKLESLFIEADTAMIKHHDFAKAVSIVTICIS